MSAFDKTAVSFADKIERAQEILGHRFECPEILCSALTHPSALDSYPELERSYERLEFLGDSVVGYIVAHMVFERFTKLDEGKLTRMKVNLVSGKSLSQVSQEEGLGSCIIFGHAEENTFERGMHSALENVYESCVGALMLDGGIEVARAFVRRTLEPKLKEELAFVPESPKSLLQEHLQKRSHEIPVYRCVESGGPAHEPYFVCVVDFKGKELGRGRGKSKKLAESKAALDALIKMGALPESVRESL